VPSTNEIERLSDQSHISEPKLPCRYFLQKLCSCTNPIIRLVAGISEFVLKLKTAAHHERRVEIQLCIESAFDILGPAEAVLFAFKKKVLKR
jgi:hypothetical protein